MSDLGQDARYALRMMSRRPGFTAMALAALGLGIGANTAIFSVVHGVALRPLPYPDPDRIVRVWETRPGLSGGARAAGFSIDHFREWREGNRSFEHLAAYQGQVFSLTGVEEPVQLSGLRVSPALFAVLSTPAFLGRALELDEEEPGKERVVVLSYSAWRKYFGADSSVIGRSLTLDGNGYNVIGVMPAGFEFPDKSTDLWTPLVLGPAPPRASGVRMVRLVPVIARLKKGVSLEQAAAEGRALLEGLRNQDPDPDPAERAVELHLLSLLDQMVAPVRPALLVLLAAVGFVLLIACANVASLLLARSSERRREMAVRGALGAGRARLLRQTLTESVLLSLTGGGFGLLLAYGGIETVKRLGPGSLPRLDEISLDPMVLGFTAGLSLLSGLLFGLAPSLYGFRLDVIGSLKVQGGPPEDASRYFRHGRLRSLLVIAEIALALVLLIGAGLLLSSFFRLIRVDPGYDPKNVLTMGLNLPGYRYASPRSRAAFYAALLERLTHIPGVASAGLVNLLPLTPGNVMLHFSIEGRPEPVDEHEIPRASLRVVSPGYFSAMGIPLLAGRDFARSDRETSPPVVIINQSLTREYFGSDDPLGKRIQFGEIVGVVSDVKHEGLQAEARPEFYVSYAQTPTLRGLRGMMGQFLAQMTLVVRTEADPVSLFPSLRGQIAGLDREIPAPAARTMEARVAESVAQPRFYAVALATFALVALLLAAVGIYGVVSYSVSQRTQETGVRMALGAGSRDILKMVLGQGLVLILLGLGIGCGAAFALTRMLKSFLFEVSVADPLIYGALTVLLGGVGLAACYLPARRAARLDPLVALRYE